VISTQNINSNNSPSKNVVIRNNRNEYISINNIQNQKEPSSKPNESLVERQLATAAKERERLAERVQTLENDKSKDRLREDVVSKLP
jgi:predicted transcriptional regulator